MMHEQTIALERQRILADLHDSLGAMLDALLHHLKSEHADRSSIEQRIRGIVHEIEDAIRATGVHLHPKMKELPAVAQRGERSDLTAREIEVLNALSRGYTYAQIGAKLGVSLGTVTSHIKNSYRKLSVHSAVAAVTRATELGLLPSLGTARLAR